MAAGDLLPTSGETYAAELRAYLMAETEDWRITDLKGLGGVKVKARDTGLDSADGSIAAADYLEDWPLIVNMRCSVGSASAAELAIVDLQDAWTASAEDLELHLWIPGREHLKVTGRPRDLEVDRIRPMSSGVAKAQAVFQVLNTLVEVVA